MDNPTLYGRLEINEVVCCKPNAGFPVQLKFLKCSREKWKYSSSYEVKVNFMSNRNS